MTPPKSVESVTNTQPLSNNCETFLNKQPLSQNASSGLYATSSRTPTTTANLITSSSSNTIMPATFDDLDNIFEEDSADEQPKHTPALIKESHNPVALNTFTTQPMSSSAAALEAPLTLPVATHNPNQFQTKAQPTFLSVVMTPPSLENLAVSSNQAHYFSEDLIQSTNAVLNNVGGSASANSYGSGHHIEFTKAIEFNDYSTIIKNKDRQNFSTLLIQNLTSETAVKAERDNHIHSIPNQPNNYENNNFFTTSDKISSKYERLNLKNLKTEPTRIQQPNKLV